MEMERYNSKHHIGAYASPGAHVYLLEEYSNCRYGAVRIACDIVCSNPQHENESIIGNKHIHAQKEWYTLPDNLIGKIVGVTGEGKSIWDHDGEQGRVKHEGVEDLLQTCMARSDGDRVRCRVCKNKGILPAHFLRSIKTPMKAELPKLLRVAIAVVNDFKPELRFSIGGWEYQLYSVIFGNKQHFTSNIRLDYGGGSEKRWFHYDGLGHRAQQPKDCKLRLMEEPDEKYWVPFRHGYVAVSYRYMRQDPEGQATLGYVSPVGVTEAEAFRVDQVQYSSMHTVLDYSEILTIEDTESD